MQIIEIPEAERFSDEFKDPSKYFIINAFGNAVYFKTNSRKKAQEKSDEIYGKGKYTVRVAMRASVR